MVADGRHASGAPLKYWADQLNVDMSPFIRARGVEEAFVSLCRTRTILGGLLDVTCPTLPNAGRRAFTGRWRGTCCSRFGTPGFDLGTIWLSRIQFEETISPQEAKDEDEPQVPAMPRTRALD